MQAGAGPGGETQSGVEFAFGVAPPARRGQHRTEVDAAFGIEKRAAVALRETVGDRAPSGRALQVTCLLAGVQHVAAGVGDRVEAATLTGERRGQGLVEQGEAFVVASLPDPGLAQLRQRDQLEIDVGARPGDREGPGGEAFDTVQIGGAVPASDPQPAVQRADVMVCEQAFGTGEPAVGDRVIRIVRLVDDRERDCAVGGVGIVAGPPETRIGTGPAFDAGVVLAEPPQRGRPAGQGPRFVGQPGQGLARVRPAALRERGKPVVQRVVRRHGSDSPTVSPGRTDLSVPAITLVPMSSPFHSPLLDALRQRVLIGDGAMGTMLQAA